MVKKQWFSRFWTLFLGVLWAIFRLFCFGFALFLALVASVFFLTGQGIPGWIFVFAAFSMLLWMF